jgi:hypothetical protein
MVQVEAVSELIKAGKIRHWGLSNETAYGVTMFCETAKRLGVPLPITIQNDYSLCERCVFLSLACTVLLRPGCSSRAQRSCNILAVLLSRTLYAFNLSNFCNL